MEIAPFGVEEWMNAHEGNARFNLAETCVSSLTVEELLALAGVNDGLSGLMPMRLTYGAIQGSDRLRDAISGLYAGRSRDDVLVTHGAIGANALIYQAMVEPGDRVVAITPNYQQHYSIPESLGAEVVRLELEQENGFLPDLDRLSELVEPGVKMISLSNPNNPTGALLDRVYLTYLVEVARGAGAWILCDEVYRGTEQTGEGITPSIADLYERGIATGSMSKAFSLAGLRLGWMVAPSEVLETAMVHRDYNTISVGKIDDHLATLALENADKILERSRGICRTNLDILTDWVEDEQRVSFVKPLAGTTALVKIDVGMPSAEFCVALQKSTGVMVLPGSVLGKEGYIRVGYAFEKDVLRDGLSRLSGFLAEIST